MQCGTHAMQVIRTSRGGFQTRIQNTTPILSSGNAHSLHTASTQWSGWVGYALCEVLEYLLPVSVLQNQNVKPSLAPLVVPKVVTKPRPLHWWKVLLWSHLLEVGLLLWRWRGGCSRRRPGWRCIRLRGRGSVWFRRRSHRWFGWRHSVWLGRLHRWFGWRSLWRFDLCLVDRRVIAAHRSRWFCLGR